MSARARYLIVDGHSVIFAWPELRKAHNQRPAHARDLLIRRLRQYQDWSGTRVVIVFDGRGPTVSVENDPHDVQIFFSRQGQTADSIIERLASKYAERHQLTVATSDHLEQETASAFGAECISPEMLQKVIGETEQPRSRRR